MNRAKMYFLINNILDKYDDGKKITEEEYINLLVNVRDLVEENTSKSLLDLVSEQQKEINDLQKKAEQGEHYKHLYSSVKKEKDSLMTALTTSREKYNNDKARYRRKYKNLKKQKDDVVEYIKEKTKEFHFENDKLIDILGMLGEIDDSN